MFDSSVVGGTGGMPGAAPGLSRRAALGGAAWLAAAVLPGCTTAEIDPVPSGATADGRSRFEAWADESPPYRIAPGDKVKVQFLLTPEVGEVALVGPDGNIGLRVAGRVPVAGLSLEQAEQAVTVASRRFLTRPIVTLSLEEAAGSLVYVGGSVRRPGPQPLVGRRGAAESIILAGGFEAEARVNEVVLIRRSVADRPMLRTVDLQAMLSTGFSPGDVPLAAGDIVFVPRSRIAEVNLWVDQFITRTIPFNRTFSYAITAGSGAKLF